MDVKELYSALEQHVMDAQENPYTIIRAARYSEVQKYLSNTGHFFDFIAIIANKRLFEALKPEYQKAVREAMVAAVAYQRKLAVDTDREAFEEIRKKMQFDEVPPAEREKMRKASAGVVEQVKKRAGAQLVDQVIAEVAKAR